MWGNFMKMIIALLVSVLSLFTTAVYAEDKPTQCIEQKILIEQLKQEVFFIRGQYYQCLPSQVPQIEQARKTSEAEEQRLKDALNPKPEKEGGKK